MLVCLLVTNTTYRLISLSTSSRCRFQTRPGRCPGRAGPHLQPRGRLRPIQRQRDACCRRPGHMKANTLCPVPLLLLLLPLPSFSSSCSSSSSTSHPPTSLALPPSSLNPHSITRMLGERGMYWGESRGQTCRFAPLSSFYSPLGEKLTLSSSTLFLHRPPHPFSPLAKMPWASICHCYIQNCLLHESKWV